MLVWFHVGLEYIYDISEYLFLLSQGFYIQPDVLTFSEHPQSQIVTENSSVVLRCTLKTDTLNGDLPTPKLRWNFNDSTAASCNVTTNNLSSNCSIASAKLSDMGWYSCQVVDGDDTDWCEVPCVDTVTVSAAAYVSVIGKNYK